MARQSLAIAAASVLVALASPLGFAAERQLTTEEIAAYLGGHYFQGKQGSAEWVQRFDESGVTVYSSGRSIDHGRWKAENDAYCSQWGNGAAWSCYHVSADGEQVTFVSVANPSDVWPAQRLAQKP
jgi:hypothetical protein